MLICITGGEPLVVDYPIFRNLATGKELLTDRSYYEYLKLYLNNVKRQDVRRSRFKTR